MDPQYGCTPVPLCLCYDAATQGAIAGLTRCVPASMPTIPHSYDTVMTSHVPIFSVS
jgi:hypothetical protein